MCLIIKGLFQGMHLFFWVECSIPTDIDGSKPNKKRKREQTSGPTSPMLGACQGQNSFLPWQTLPHFKNGLCDHYLHKYVRVPFMHKYPQQPRSV